MPFTSLAVIILIALYFTGIIPPDNYSFSFAVWIFIIALVMDTIVHIARMAGFGNRDDIRITR